MSWMRRLGFDNLREDYTYAVDPTHGYTASKKIAEGWVSTTCGYCSVGCGMQIGVKEGKAVAVRGLDNHPVNVGKLCPKGLSEHYPITSPDRAKYPLLRSNGKLLPVDWGEAIGTMVEKIRSLQKENGPGTLGVISTGQLLTEEFYTLGKLVQLGFGTTNFDGNTTLCMASAVAGYKRTFGSDGPPGAYDDLETADVIFLIGANIADNHPILCRRLEANPHAKVIVVDPRVTKTAMQADIHLPIKPRSDIALLNGIAHILLREGLIDRGYIERHTSGFAELETFLAEFTPEAVARVTGLSMAQIELVAALYGRAKAPLLAWTMGVNHSTQGAETVSAICNLSLMTGKIGYSGAGPLSITGQCNAMGTREAGFTSGLPGYRKFESAEHRRELAEMWGVEEASIPRKRGLAYPDIIDAAVKGEVRALWVIATNPVVSFPDVPRLEMALRSLDFLVVQDGFHPTPTSERADLVLPAATWGEKEGIYTNSERRASKVNAAVAAPGLARSDFQIFLSIAERLGMRSTLFPNWNTPRHAFEEWKRVSKGRLCDYSGMTYELLEEHGGLQWPFPEGCTDFSTKRLYSDGRFETADGKAVLHCVKNDPFPEQPNEKFPLILNTGRTVEHWHTRTKTGQVGILEHMAPNAWLEMNPDDAAAMQLHSHDLVNITSRRGSVNGVELRITGIIAPGQVFMPFHFSETNVNIVTQGAFDPISREPNYKQSAVRVEKART